MTDPIQYILSGGMTILSAIGAISVRILWQLAANVAELNQKMAVICSELAHNTARADKTDETVQALGHRLLAVERNTIYERRP